MAAARKISVEDYKVELILSKEEATILANILGQFGLGDLTYPIYTAIEEYGDCCRSVKGVEDDSPHDYVESLSNPEAVVAVLKYTPRSD